jgi:hypothetical protein
MFTNVSWASYLMGVALLYLSWYAYIGLRYYREELQRFLSGKKRPVETGNDAIPSEGTPNFFIEEKIIAPNASYDSLQDSVFKDVDHLIGKIKEFTQGSAQKNANKEEFTGYLSLLLAEYPAVKDSVFRSQINEHLVQECASGQSFTLSEQEADQLW